MKVNLKRCFLGIAVLLAAACLACHQSAPVETSQTQAAASPTPGSAAANLPVILAFGDSLTAGYGLAPAQSYPSLLQEKLSAAGYHYQVINAGISGDTAKTGLQRLEWKLDGNVKFVILGLGGNDILQRHSMSETKEQLAQIITRIKARNAEVLLVGLYAPKSYDSTYQQQVRETYKELSKEHGVVLLPFMLEHVEGVKSLNLEDGIHPNAEGTKIVADTVYRALRPMLDKAQEAH